jgi:hypothetical protein
MGPSTTEVPATTEVSATTEVAATTDECATTVVPAAMASRSSRSSARRDGDGADDQGHSRK